MTPHLGVTHTPSSFHTLLEQHRWPWHFLNSHRSHVIFIIIIFHQPVCAMGLHHQAYRIWLEIHRAVRAADFAFYDRPPSRLPRLPHSPNHKHTHHTIPPCQNFRCLHHAFMIKAVYCKYLKLYFVLHRLANFNVDAVLKRTVLSSERCRYT